MALHVRSQGPLKLSKCIRFVLQYEIPSCSTTREMKAERFNDHHTITEELLIPQYALISSIISLIRCIFMHVDGYSN